MFGINKLRDKVDQLEKIVECLRTESGANARFIEAYSDRMASIVKYQIDAKSELSSIKHQIQMVATEVMNVKKGMEKYEDMFDAFLESRYEKDESLKLTLDEFISKQNMIFQYMHSLEELLETTETIMEELKPEKKIPKLPKSETATN